MLTNAWLTAYAGLGIALFSSGICLHLWRRVRRLQAQLEEQLRYIQTQHQQSADTVGGVGRKLLALQEAVQQLAARTHLDPNTANEYKAYNQAATMLQQGVRLDEVMEKCHLTRGEAELLASMHRAAQGERPH